MKKYIAAVSGGPDSMAMLDMYKDQVVAVCHVNYNKRKTSKRDKEYVKSYCNQQGIKFYSKTVSRIFYFIHRKNNFQNLARKIRYDFFCKIANELKVETVIVAHTLDDFVETAFIQKRKNTQTLFFGITEYGKYRQLKIFRPLISMRKKEIILYCKKKKIPYGLDETNLLNIYERNIVRKEVSKWPKNKFEAFLHEIKKQNENNKELVKKSIEEFDQWVSSDFKTSLFKKNEEIIRREMIKKLFRAENIEYHSEEKFKQLDKFICLSESGKEYRVGNKKKIKKTKNNIIVLGKK